MTRRFLLLGYDLSIMTVCVLAYTALLCSCAANLNQGVNGDSRAEISEPHAIEIAKGEILRRGIAVPRHPPWTAALFSDTEPVRPIYWVVFAPRANTEGGIQVMVDRESAKVADFVDPRSFITAPAAIEIAKKELSRRGVSLAKSWEVKVKNSSITPEFRVERPQFAVLFNAPEKGKRAAVYYYVAIDKRTGRIYSFDKSRIPLWHGE